MSEMARTWRKNVARRYSNIWSGEERRYLGEKGRDGQKRVKQRW